MTTRLQGRPLTGPATPHDLLRTGLGTDPDRPALIASTGRVTFAELDRKSSRLAAGLLALGLRPGDRVASLMPNRPGLIVHYLACFKAGLVATPLNYRYTATEIDHALAVSDASALLVHTERVEGLAESRLAGDLRRGWITYGPGGGTGPSFAGLVDDGPDGEPPALPAPDPSAPAMIFFTSGSTGPAKGVTHSHESIGWIMTIGAAGLELSAADSLLAGSSLSHLGAFYISCAALSVGATAIVARTFDGDELLPLLREDRPTVLSMLPAALFALTRDHGACADDFSTLRLCRAAGDSVSAELEREFTSLSGFAIDEAYGLTEVGLATLSPPSGRIKVGSIGVAVPGVALSIRDDDGREVGEGEEGRLWIRTPGATVGYWDDPAATDAVFRDGWLDSGDVVRADAEGYLFFRGRRKQIIVHDGSNITPQEVEAALVEHPSVAAAGAIGIHDAVHGERVRAYVTYIDGAEPPTSQDLIRFARERIGYKAPEEIVVLGEMPRTPTGKTDRTALKRAAEEALTR